MASWDATNAKGQLRLTALRLGQLQERKDSTGQVTRRDIATLLQQGNVGLARAKAQNLIQDDAMGDLLEVLEMHVGVILEHFHELEQRTTPSPIVAEAAASIIYAAPQTESKDLNIVREFLIQYLGPDFARSAIGNRDNYVSSRVLKALSAPPISAARLNDYISTVATSYGVKWTPELRPQDILNALSEALDPASSPVVDLPRLRKLCSNGIPDDPPWIRPRVWKLFFGMLPVIKASWEKEISKQRESYYDLIRRLLETYSNLPPPAVPLATADGSLMDAYNQLTRVPHSLFGGLGEEPEPNPLCPLDDSAPEDIKIACASNLDARIRMIHILDQRHAASSNATPEIRLESDDAESTGIPAISLSEPESFAGRRPGAPTTLLPSRAWTSPSGHPKHSSALLRLLYIHSCLNPAHHSPHVPSLLVPLYSVMVQEIEQQDLAHAEADTFWLFEAIVGEFAELEEEEGSNLWMRKLGERLAWADQDLSENLHAKGLDPALPHYSYRWLAPLLTQTLPLSSVFMVWDALFSYPMRERDSNPKLEHLLDICTSLLIRARVPLFRLGKPGRRSPGLWVDENTTVPPPSPLRPWELGDAFLEGMSLLQLYPVEAAGGIDRILQTASDLARRREDETKTQKAESLSLGARLATTMWKGFTNQVSQDDPDSSPEDSEEEPESDDPPDDGNETETERSKPNGSASPGLSARFANTVWRGMTNQSAMDAPPSPLTPLTPSPRSPAARLPPLPPPPSEIDDAPPHASPSLQASAALWSYTNKLKDSDTAATLAKVSSNWRAKAMAWSVRGGATSPSPQDASSTQDGGFGKTRSGSVNAWQPPRLDEGRRGSMPGVDRSAAYSPPARPAFFRPPRDSMMPPPRNGPGSFSPTSPESPKSSPQSDSGLMRKARESLASFQGLHLPAPVAATPTPKSGPRPLLLGTAGALHTPSRSIALSRSANSTPVPSTRGHSTQEQWSDVMRSKRAMMHKESQSSISSLSPSDALGKPVWTRGGRGSSDWDSDSPSNRLPSSRVVPINRRSVSPMAPNFRMPYGRPDSMSSGTTSDRGMLSPPMAGRRTSSESATSYDMPQGEVKSIPRRGLSDGQDSPATLASPPAPRTPPVMAAMQGRSTIHVEDVDADSQRDLESYGTPLEPPAQARKLVRKKTPPPKHQDDDTSDSSASFASFNKSPRLRTKRHASRPSNLRIRANSHSTAVPEQRSPSPNSLAPDSHDPHDAPLTPRALDFDGTDSAQQHSGRVRKTSHDGQEGGRVRKVSTDSQDARVVRKVSDAQTVRMVRKVSTDRKRESAAEEGDDEGYDDLLSAYESEDDPKRFDDLR
ncbi:hypothetical protein PLICRDRAFT_161896 [Plicaturopsis crispa FD-325 SS-3]|nr:hypothetical protein PLICRDRAFT_161896 [Plicaturopsis crispa FD-325 SS-3]